MNYGKINIVAGSVGILLASIGGMMLGLTYNDLFKDGSYMIDLSRAFLKAAHTHGQPLAMYNLIFALLINQSHKQRREVSKATHLCIERLKY